MSPEPFDHSARLALRAAGNEPHGFRDRVMSLLVSALRLYTVHIPFMRGRGAFIRAIEALKRRGWPAPSVELHNGLKMEFEPSLVGWTCFMRGIWEPEQTAAISNRVNAGSTVLNVGANTGYYSLLAGSLVKPGGHVHAFEIQPEIADILRRNIALNDMQDVVTIVEVGCFSVEGQATLHHQGDPGKARVSFDSTGVRVPLTTIDTYVDEHELRRVDLIIIDTEGADLEVLRGALRTLARHRPVILAEAHHLAEFGGSEEEMLALMTNCGYAAQAIASEFSRDFLFLPVEPGFRSDQQTQLWNTPS